MSDHSLTRFCGCLETVVGLVAVSAEWRHRLGADDWPWASAMLRPTGQLAPCYPNLDREGTGSAYHVVWRDEEADRYVASCPDGAGTLELRGADLVVYELNRAALAGRICDALGLVPDYGEVEGVRRAERIGVRDAMGDDETWFYLAVQADGATLSDTMAMLHAQAKGPFVLLTPTRAAWNARRARAASHGRLAAIDEALVVTDVGRWATARGGELMTRSAGGDAGGAAHGSVAAYVPDGNTMRVLRILAASRTLMKQPDIEAATVAQKGRLSLRTIGRILRDLRDRGMVEYPEGRNHGARITAKGAALTGKRSA